MPINALETHCCCPLCKSSSYTVLQKFDSKSTDSHIYGREQVSDELLLSDHVRKLWNSNECLFVKCDHCSLSYASPFISGDQFFYETVYGSALDYPSWKWEFDVTLANMQQVVSENEKLNHTLLEVGAGNGTFIKGVSNTLKAESILTTEYSNAGKAAIDSLGIRCEKMELWELCDESNKNKFNFICMFQVLEHLDNLDKTFGALSFLCADQGYLFVAVPNNTHREYYEELGFVEDVPPTHISRWSEESFEWAASKYGWKLIDHRREPNKLYKNISKYLSFKYSDYTLVKWVNGIKYRMLRLSLRMLIFIPFLLFNITAFRRLNNKDLGVVQWVALQKN